MIYTNSGLAILALASNAVHKLWKWQRNDRNLNPKVFRGLAKALKFLCNRRLAFVVFLSLSIIIFLV